jgi:hypothetical protein
MSHLKIYALIVFLALTLCACSGSAASEPEMIASFPVQNSSAPQPINPPQPAQFVYDATLELDVTDLDRAAGRAVDLAYQYSGYLVSSHSWQSGKTSHASLVLAVPAVNFDAAYNALSQLGDLVNQHISGQWVSSRPGDGWEVYSEITLQLNDPDSAWPRLIGGWSPLHTLQSAWNFFVTIFGFLADVVIWLVVVVGPFLILAWLLRLALKRLRRTP